MNANPDTTTAPVREIPCGEAWDASLAAYKAARAATSAAGKARVKAADDLGEEALNFPDSIWRHPKVAPFSRAEQAAEKEATAARDAVLVTLAPSWLALAAKFNIVREHIDNVLDPLDPRDFKRSEREFPGTRAAAQAHHLALAAHHGLLKARHLTRIPKLIAKMARKAEGLGDLSDPAIQEALNAGNDGILRGLVSTYLDAVRLIDAAPQADGADAPASVAQEPRPEPTFLEGLLTESHRIDCLAAGLPNCTHQEMIDRLDGASGVLFREFINTPITSPGEAAIKLRFVSKGFEDGTHNADPELTEQVIAYLEAAGSAATEADAAYPTCRAEIIADGIVEVLKAEMQENGTTVASALIDRRDEMTAQLSTVKATTRPGAICQAAAALEYVEMLRSCTAQEDRDFYQGRIEFLLTSALAVLAPDIHPVLKDAYFAPLPEPEEAEAIVGREAIREHWDRARAAAVPA